MERIVEDYLKKLTEQIRYEKMRPEIAKEYEEHIEDQTQEYQKEGISREESLQKAVQMMGDPVAAGNELDHIHRPKTDVRMLILIAILSISSLLVLGFVGNISRIDFVHQLTYMFLGSGMMIGIYYLDYGFLGKYAKRILVAGVVITAILGSILGQDGIYYQMISPMYLFAPVFGAIVYQYRGKKTTGLIKCILLMIIPVVVVVYGTSSLPTAANLMLISFILLIYAVSKDWFSLSKGKTIFALISLYVILPMLFVIMVYQFFLREYQRARILAFINPGTTEVDYIYIRIRESLQGCHFIGTADGLPELLPAANEYLFVQMILTYGICFGILLFVLLTIFLIRVFKITFHQKNLLGRMVGTGCFLAFLVQLVEGILMNFGFFPATALNLPFLSLGIGATITCYLLSGILLSIYRYQNISMFK